MAVLLSLLQTINADGGGLVPGGDKGLTAGWAQRCWFWALYGVNTPGDVLLELPQKRLPEGAMPESQTVQWTVCPANARAYLRGPEDGRMMYRAEPYRRVGAAMLVLGTLWGSVPRRGSAGDAAKAPARGGGQALPGGLRP